MLDSTAAGGLRAHEDPTIGIPYETGEEASFGIEIIIMLFPSVVWLILAKDEEDWK